MEQKPRFRGFIHAGAFITTLVVGPILIAHAHSATDRIALLIYVVSLLALFGVSATFHLGHWSPAVDRRLRRADHSTIFLAIAGTYTAVATLTLTNGIRLLALCLVWGGAIAGVLVRQFLMDAPKWAIALPYVIVGWSALVLTPQLVRGASLLGFVLVLAGGISYTVGALIYARRKPDPIPDVFGFHEVFHACTVVGAGLQFIAIAFVILPRT